MDSVMMIAVTRQGKGPSFQSTCIFRAASAISNLLAFCFEAAGFFFFFLKNESKAKQKVTF